MTNASLKKDAPFVCVLKGGGRYTPDHVARLSTNIRIFNPTARIICLTDTIIPNELNVESIPLKYDLPGWFSKLEIFALDPGFFYMDLDVKICARIDTGFPKGLFILRDFGNGSVNSSLMYVDKDCKKILYDFLKNSKKYIEEYSTPDKWGDQDFIRDYGKIDGYLQDINPQLARSWKKDFKYKLGLIKNPPSILVFHGNPKPEDISIKLMPDGSIKLWSWKYLLKYLLKKIKS